VIIGHICHRFRYYLKIKTLRCLVFRVKTIEKYVKILIFICKEGQTSVPSILRSFEINRMTFYSTLKKWQKDGYIRTQKGEDTYLIISKTKKLCKVLKSLKKELCENSNRFRKTRL